jgi:pimeloyl-ACP methyl ester carboxylesterase
MTLQVPGATLHLETAGRGPLLLVLQGGAGDAQGSAGLLKHLSDRYTLLSYDRRGLSRSKVDDPKSPTSIAQHADDASEVIRAVTGEAVFAVGISIGAVIGIELARRHPQQVRALVAHEPPLPQLLPEELEAIGKAQEQVEAVHRNEGLPAAMALFLKMTGFDLRDRESDLEMPRPNPAYAENMEFFLTHDAPATRLYRLDVSELVGRRIVPTAGERSRGLWTHRCSKALADALRTRLVETPGGHNAYAMHPRAFSAKLDEVLRTL